MPRAASFIQPYIVSLSERMCTYTWTSTMHFAIPVNNPRAQRINQNTSRGLTMEQKSAGNEFSGTTWGYKRYLQGEKATKQSKGRWD